MKNHPANKSILWAVLAAALYALNAPFSKLLLKNVSATMLASLLYLGAGLGMFLLSRIRKNSNDQRLSRRDLPYVLGMILLDIAAPILLMLGLSNTTPANATLLNNFEIVATSIIALLIFHEAVSKRLWIAIVLITISSIILSFEDTSSLHFSIGSLFVLLACICWGFENNCTRMLSQSNPLEIVIIKGFGSGIGSMILAISIGERIPAFNDTVYALLLGFVAYGLSIFFYVRAQRDLGAARTSAYYALSPFIGVALSLLIFHELPSASFILALIIMIGGVALASTNDGNT